MAADREYQTATQPGAKTAGRRRRLPWFDPRFAIGLILVVVSVLGVVGLVNAANASIDVLAARSTLTPGERVHSSDLVPTSVRVSHTSTLYLSASDVPAAGLIVTRAVAAGELVPDSAVGSEAGAELTSVVVSVNTALPASVAPGSRVDLWAAMQGGSDLPSGQGTDADGTEPVNGGAGSFGPPTVLVSSAIVVRLIDQKQLVASTGSSVELLVPKADTASVLDAIANGAVLSVVPVDLPLGN
jgi:hypothetical protein